MTSISLRYNRLHCFFNSALGFAIALCMVVYFPVQAWANDDKAAEAFAQKTANAVLTLLKSPSASEREKEFRQVFVDNTDIRRVARFALGQYARTPSAEQFNEYVDLLEDFVAKVYVNRLMDYTNETVKVTNSLNKGSKNKEVIVNSLIVFPSERKPVSLNWWLLREDGGYKIFDLQVAGVWMAQEQRATFVSVLQSGNGDFSTLINHLKNQTQNVSKS